MLLELTSHKKTKSRQQQRPQHGGHGSPDSRPAAATQARRSAPIAAAASRTKCNNSNKVRVEMRLLMASSGRRFHPGGCSLLSDRISLTLSCRSSVVSFRREEAAPLRGASSSFSFPSSSSSSCSYCCCGRSSRAGLCYAAVNALLAADTHSEPSPDPGGRTPNFPVGLVDWTLERLSRTNSDGRLITRNAALHRRLENIHTVIVAHQQACWNCGRIQEELLTRSTRAKEDT